ncbi:MAG TPA: helical backbone metal receptor [Burkholderiaceae bacterium]|nr:helical backbone metal receptor [Burkholderiaceae bacterium]
MTPLNSYKTDPLDLIDTIGQQHAAVDFQLAAPRIVCLVPSITELLCDLGLAPYLVGRTGFCIHPAAVVANIPKIGGTKDVNIEKIRTLAPTHLIVNIDENEKPTVDALAQFVPHVVVTHPMTPSDNLNLYRLLGGIFGAEEAAKALCTALEQEIKAIRGAAPATPKTVLYCIWKDPWMTVSRDTYIAAMLAQIGWAHWQAEPSTATALAVRYPKFAWTLEVLDGIDEILLSSEPYRFTPEHVAELTQQSGKPVRLVDGEMLSWYGSRAIRGLRYLREIASA